MKLFWLALFLTMARADEPAANDAEILKDLEFFQNLEVVESQEMLLEGDTEMTEETQKEGK